MNKLSSEEKEFSEKNHELVLQFLKYNRLTEDYYDIVVFGYLRAVKSYMNDDTLQKKYPFYIIAKRKMKDSLIAYWHYLNRKKRVKNQDIICLNDIEQTLSSNIDIERSIIVKQLVSSIYERLTEKEKRVVSLRLKECKISEIRQSCNISEKKLYQCLKEIQQKLGKDIYEMLHAA